MLSAVVIILNFPAVTFLVNPLDWIACRWHYGPRFCQETLGPLLQW